MRFIIALGHPAHYHLFKNSARILWDRGHTLGFAVRDKDVLKQLLLNDHVEFTELGKRRGGLSMNKWLQYPARIADLMSLVRKFRPDLMLGTNGEVAHVGFLMGIPNMLVTEDDHHVTPLYAATCFPFAKHLLVPDTCDVGRWDRKSVKYPSYHELAYLHPNHFRPDEAIVRRYFPAGRPYFILRFVSLKAHHDKGIRGIDGELAGAVIQKLLPHGDVYVSSERPLEPALERYRIRINPVDMHHVLAFAHLFIGDSQTMAAECAVLGTPFVRFNDFVGRIGYLNDLELRFGLGKGIHPSRPEELLAVIDTLLADKELRESMQQRRAEMLSQKIDAAAFIADLLEHYPDSMSRVGKAAKP